MPTDAERLAEIRAYAKGPWKTLQAKTWAEDLLYVLRLLDAKIEELETLRLEYLQLLEGKT